MLNDKRSYLQYGGLAVLLFLLFGMQDLLFKAVDYHGAVSCVDVDLQMSPMAAFWILIWLLPKLLMFSVCFYQFVRIYESKSCYFFIRNTKKKRPVSHHHQKSAADDAGVYPDPDHRIGRVGRFPADGWRSGVYLDGGDVDHGPILIGSLPVVVEQGAVDQHGRHRRRDHRLLCRAAWMG